MIEEMVQEHLAGALENGDVNGVGLWVDQQLLGVAAWRFVGQEPGGPCLCSAVVLAVETDHGRRGYGHRLKQELIENARQAGANAVVSVVHWDNDPMIRLNAGVGARVRPIDGDPDYCRCIIAL